MPREWSTSKIFFTIWQPTYVQYAIWKNKNVPTLRYVQTGHRLFRPSGWCNASLDSARRETEPRRTVTSGRFWVRVYKCERICEYTWAEWREYRVYYTAYVHVKMFRSYRKIPIYSTAFFFIHCSLQCTTQPVIRSFVKLFKHSFREAY